MLVKALMNQLLVENNRELAERLAENCQVENVEKGKIIMEEDTSGNELLMILSGKFQVFVGGTRLSELSEGNHVGDMAIVDPDSKRSATIVAGEDSVVARIDGEHFSAVAESYPQLWKNLAVELANRLRQTNRWMTEWEPKPRDPDIEE